VLLAAHSETIFFPLPSGQEKTMLSFLAHIDSEACCDAQADEGCVSERHAPTAINAVLWFIHRGRLICNMFI
jgi:hypothetical protein